MDKNKQIILAGVNAKYTHTSLALRYLYANLLELQDKTELLEFTINENTQDICEKILSYKPKIVALSVYIWNAPNITQIISTIKNISPQTYIILGGPEVSYLPHRSDFSKADTIIKGEGEEVFYKVCKEILEKHTIPQPFIEAKAVDLERIKLPYSHYSDFDLRNRYTYVESSRGCPFGCEFCLSSLDKKVRYFPVEHFLESLEDLWRRGCRNFKFIDRTFNLNINIAQTILTFFLEKKEDYFLHFEVIPENFPERLKKLLSRFRGGALQLEVGIQTLNSDVAKKINRKLDMQKIKNNIQYLESLHIHLHLDLIVGLPSESLESFANNLDTLTSLSSSEIQIGILKKLSGTTLGRHDAEYGMIYNDQSPYDLLCNDLIDFATMQQMKRFGRFWDIFYNSGNFFHSMKVLFEDKKVFENFFSFSNFIYETTHSTWQISLNRQSELLFSYLTQHKRHDKTFIADTLLQDIIKIKGRSIPEHIRAHASSIPDLRQNTISKDTKRQNLRQNP